LGGDFKDIYKFSIISEIIHTGTLIIDDIEDKSELRRGERVLHKIYGEEIAINCGVFIHFFPQLIIKNSNLSYFQKSALYDVISSELTKVHLGQGMDISWSKEKRFDISLDEYLQMSVYKTSALLNVALKFGAILAGANNKVLANLEKVSERMGMAFQIQDDILNLKAGSEWGKEIGEDITEGKITYMVCYTFTKAKEKEKKELKDILSSRTKDKKEIEKVINILERYKSFNKASTFAKGLILSAKNDIDNILEDSDYKRIFLEALDYMIQRNK
jgi:geranylgeranyl pyrophosphate synthase